MRIAIVSRLTDSEQQIPKIHEAAGKDMELMDFSEDRNGLIERGRDVEIVYGNVRPHELPRLTQLRWVHATWSGVENLLYPEMIERDVIITNTRGQSAVPMAEHALAGLLYLARNFPVYVQSNPQKQWRADTHPTLLEGSCALVLGMGAVGQVLALKLKALGVKVIGVNSDGRPTKGCEATCTLDAVREHLGRVDHLIVLLPATEQTHKVVNRSFMASLRPGAGVVNLSRGQVLDENALRELVDEDHLRGAVLDVTDPEPPQQGNPLWDHPRILLTGHQSWKPSQGDAMAFETFLRNLQHYRESRIDAMINRVDPERGY